MMKTFSIYYNSSTDIYHHLAAEKHLLTTLLRHTINLYIWRSDDAVVIGKHQNLWKECNFRVCQSHGITMARRISGGGAVFLDMGTVNISFLCSADLHLHRNDLYTILLHSLQKNGIYAERNKKNDIVINNKKISGSSSCIKRSGTLIHSALLINTDLNVLKQALQPSFTTISGHSVESHHSDVMNIAEINKSLTVNEVIQTLIEQFKSFYNTDTPVNMDPPSLSIYRLKETYMEMSGTQWMYGHNPPWEISYPPQYGENEKQKAKKRGTIQTAILIKSNVPKELSHDGKRDN